MAGPQTLVYAKGGYTNARLDVLASDGSVDRRENFELNGYRLGAGVEQAIGSRAYAKVEYRYSNYNNADFQFRDGSTTSQFDIDTDRHQVVAGVGIRF
jgi:outer membrane immunogenic protein